MILATQTLLFSERLGDYEAIRLLSQAGFDALDYTMVENLLDPKHPLRQNDYRAYASALKEAAARSGVYFNQAHAPFPTYIDHDPSYNQMIQPLVERSIEVAAILGARTIVIHPIDATEEKRKKELNRDYYMHLQPLCEKFGIKIALENMWEYDSKEKRFVANVCSTGETFAEYLDELDPLFFTACLDLGHCGLVGQEAAMMIRQLGHDRLTALHIHDNDFQDDRHTLPFLGQMDWEAITKALAEIQYTGDLTFEVDKSLTQFPDALLPDLASFLHAIGRQLIQMIERHRS